MCLEDWATTYRRRQWGWAHKLVTHLANHWAGIAIKWTPEAQGRNRAKGRSAGRPKKRWADDIQQYLTNSGYGDWMDVAQDKEQWDNLEDEFVKTYASKR
eukprot:2148627-Karenia_brevis.AAC.1